ncbi:MAG: pentapeptide repeat-containing protein [Candidatus Acidiferrales bacterium]
MAFLFKRALPVEGTGGLVAPTDLSSVLRISPQKPPSAIAPSEPASNDEAMLKDFLIKNFLLDDPPAEISVLETSHPETRISGSPSKPAADTNEPVVIEQQSTTNPVSLRHPENDAVADPDFMAAEPIAEPPRIDASEWALEEKLASHKEWLDSQSAAGSKADLQKARLDGRELIGVSLRYADLQEANLQGADLLLADLRDACLVRANLQETCLVGANLEGANLEGASLETAMGLLPRQLAGTNLHEASVPGTILEFDALADFQRTALTAGRLFVTTVAVSLLSCLMIWKTKDVQLLTDSAIIPFLHSSAAAAAAPTDEIYLIAPAALLVVFLWFLYHLQRVWDAVLELPAVFPDGHVLGQKSPRIVVGLLRTHFRWMNPDAPSTRMIEKGLSVLLAYWLVPIVLLLYWARYLTLQEIHGTILQEVLILVAVGVALYCSTGTGRPAEKWAERGKPTNSTLARLQRLKPASVLIFLFAALTLLSAGTIAGVPHDQRRAPQFASADIRRWAPDVLWIAGYDPYAELTEASISSRPANWTGADDQLSSVRGAHLNGTNFRYAQAYGIFLAGAHLFRANFQGAFLSEADLRGADLGQANLKFAVLDRAQMNHANLDRAGLDGANLTRVDLRNANLSYSSLAGAELTDARLDGVSFYGAHAENASLVRGNLEKADMREAHLDGANLDGADLQQAYLWSTKLRAAHLQNAQLATAIFIDADLQGADLHGAHFAGTVLNGANLQDANLDGADLRGALQLTAYQVCSARSHRAAILDDTLQTQVDAQCGPPHQP